MVCLENKWDHSFLFENAPVYCISDSFVDHEGYSISSKGFLPTVVDIMVIWIKFTLSHPFSSLISNNVHSCQLLSDQFQFTMIPGPNFPGSYAILFLHHRILFSPLDTSTTEHSFCFDSAFSFFLELFLCFSPVAYWAPTNLGSSSFSVISFCLFILFMGILRQKFWNCFAIPFFSGPHFVNTLHRYRPSWMALQGMPHCFILRRGCDPYDQFG